MSLAPIAIFTYNRPWHTRQTVEALQKNEFAHDSDLFVFSDGAKSESAQQAVAEVRKYIHQIDRFKSVTIIEREKNLGLANSIISGVTQLCSEYGRVIVIEDDLVTSPFFLKFMNEGLQRYELEKQVISIHGYVYPVRTQLPETFFLKGADCWGWATWQRGWQLFEADGQKLLDELKQKNLDRTFDFDGTYGYTKMLQGQILGENNSWAVRWYASAFLRNKLTLYPGRSLVHNIGNDGGGTHCGVSNTFDTQVANRPILVANIPIEESIFVRQEIISFFRKKQPSWFTKIGEKLKLYVNNSM